MYEMSRAAAGGGNPAGILGWFGRVDDLLLARARDMPACWGGQLRVSDDGLYVDEATMAEVLPGDLADLYVCLGNAETDERLVWMAREVASRLPETSWFKDLASDLAGREDAVVYYTEVFPDDLTQDELVELADTRPDLFAAPALEAWPELARALDAARSGDLAAQLDEGRPGRGGPSRVLGRSAERGE